MRSPLCVALSLPLFVSLSVAVLGSGCAAGQETDEAEWDEGFWTNPGPLPEDEGDEDEDEDGESGMEDGDSGTDGGEEEEMAGVCGDGVVEADEQCDDANDDANDDCVDCRIAYCGDGIVHTGVEQCDDGNESGQDKCLPTTCSLNVCGDGILNPTAEACDDGNADENDACPSSCEAAYCGDGIVQIGVEDCDDANDAFGDGCTPQCVGELDAQCDEPYELLDEATRNITYSGTVTCDSTLELGWYRFSGDAGVEMPTWAPAPMQCGTHAPGWVDGELPSVLDGVVGRVACFNWGDDTCAWSTSAKVVNCGDHYLFELRPTPDCGLRYCGIDP